MNREKVVDGLAMYGRIKSTMNTIIVVIVSLIVFVVGIMWSRSSSKDPHTMIATATLRNVQCNSTFVETTTKSGTKSKTEHVTCTADAQYKVGAVGYTAQRLSFTGRHSDGEQVSLWYNPVNPNDVISSKPAPPYVGYILAALACATGIGSVAYTYFMSKSRTFAAVHGTKEAIDDAGDVFRGVFRGGEGVGVTEPMGYFE